MDWKLCFTPFYPGNTSLASLEAEKPSIWRTFGGGCGGCCGVGWSGGGDDTCDTGCISTQ